MTKFKDLLGLTALLKLLAESPALMIFLMGLAGIGGLVFVVHLLRT